MLGPTIRPDLDHDLVEARLAARLASALRESSEQLPADVQERLRFARQQALAKRPAMGGNTAASRTAGGALMLGRLGLWWPRLGALLPVLVLAVGAWLVDDARERDEQRVAVAIDVALLADDLPPEAYADPGFVAFLKLQQP
jgi:hypothetical protein